MKLSEPPERLTGTVQGDEVADWLRAVQGNFGPSAALAIRKKYSFLGDHFIDEVLVNTLVRVYQHRDTYRPEKGSFGAWFNKIAMNECVRRFDYSSSVRRSYFRTTWPCSAILGPGTMTGTKKSTQSAPRQLEDLEKAMSKLKPRDREILVRSIVHGNDSPSIGRELKMEPGAVRVALNRALGRLRAWMLHYQGSIGPENVQ